VHLMPQKRRIADRLAYHGYGTENGRCFEGCRSRHFCSQSRGYILRMSSHSPRTRDFARETISAPVEPNVATLVISDMASII
jgi:hypothetical protein